MKLMSAVKDFNFHWRDLTLGYCVNESVCMCLTCVDKKITYRK